MNVEKYNLTVNMEKIHQQPDYLSTYPQHIILIIFF